ncbi:cell wall protein DAN4-like [Homarus americanus]|uniref:cell wall protein DAN4-like n=1 Tax=Homarus americanus TaxID=6706 RepID=UPI001C471E11|nr:cell wall protein DAN4-like [Homarus americanus]
MRRLLVLLFPTFILLSYTAASVVGGRSGGGRSRPDDLQDDGSQRTQTATTHLGARLPHQTSSLPTIKPPRPPHKTSVVDLTSDFPTVASSVSTYANTTTRRLFFPTARKETSTTTPSISSSPANETRPSEDPHRTPGKPDVPEILPNTTTTTSTTTTTTTVAPPPKTTTPVYRLGAVFEPEHIQSLSSIFFQSLQEQNRLIGGAYRLEGVAVETPALTLNALKGACETLKFEGVSVGVAVGVTQSIYASGTLASLAGVPLIARSVKGYVDETLKFRIEVDNGN